jgi:hypothetical protein
MPVLQGDQPAGDIIGGLLGAAGAFIGGQQRAKQQKAEQARQAAQDAQAVSEALYRHAEDQKRDAREDTTAAQQTTVFNQGQGDRAHDEAIATAAGQFVGKEKLPKNWAKMTPQQQVDYLRNRQQIEHSQQGTIGAGPYEQTTKDIAARQTSLDKGSALQERISEAQKNRDAAMQRAMIAPGAAESRQAASEAASWERTLAVIGGEDARQQATFAQQMQMLQLRFGHEDAAAAKKPKPATPVNHQFAAEENGLNSNADFKGLPAASQSIIRGSVSAHGMQATLNTLRKIAGGAQSPMMTKDAATEALSTLTGQ